MNDKILDIGIVRIIFNRIKFMQSVNRIWRGFNLHFTPFEIRVEKDLVIIYKGLFVYLFQPSSSTSSHQYYSYHLLSTTLLDYSLTHGLLFNITYGLAFNITHGILINITHGILFNITHRLPFNICHQLPLNIYLFNTF